jgi:hypothetical protein
MVVNRQSSWWCLNSGPLLHAVQYILCQVAVVFAAATSSSSPKINVVGSACYGGSTYMRTTCSVHCRLCIAVDTFWACACKRGAFQMLWCGWHYCWLLCRAARVLVHCIKCRSSIMPLHCEWPAVSICNHRFNSQLAGTHMTYSGYSDLPLYSFFSSRDSVQSESVSSGRGRPQCLVAAAATCSCD